MGKQYEELGITDAFMFAKVMSNKEICKPVLEQILNIKIRDIEYLDYEETIQIALGSKSIRLDIYVEDDKNTVFNLEMQTTNYEELPKRSRYYQDIIGLKLIEKGQSYDILKTSYVIFICTFDFFEKNRSIKNPVCIFLKLFICSGIQITQIILFNIVYIDDRNKSAAVQIPAV